MAVSTITIEKFIELSKIDLVVDVRSPSEFQHAHFPNAHSVPLFDDEERKIVGTAYKKISRELAIKHGLDFFGVKMKAIVEKVESLIENNQSKTVLVHCWRGGMRSAAISWLLDLYGFKVFVLNGGYKSFRNWTLNKLKTNHPLIILSGYTGSGKTEILHEMQRLGENVVDLEGMAHHKGSTFGALGMSQQPSNEQFENNLALTLSDFDEKKPIFVESESSRIGNVNINQAFFNQMKSAQRIRIVVPIAARLDKITAEYGHFDKVDLIEGVERIQKRLGGLDTKRAVEFINNGMIREAFEILTRYYDKYYILSTLYQPPLKEINLIDTDAKTNAQIVLNELKTLYNVRSN